MRLFDIDSREDYLLEKRRLKREEDFEEDDE